MDTNLVLYLSNSISVIYHSGAQQAKLVKTEKHAELQSLVVRGLNLQAIDSKLEPSHKYIVFTAVF